MNVAWPTAQIAVMGAQGAANILYRRELAAAAELVLGKTAGTPAAVIRGVDARGEGSAREFVIPEERDLFR